MTPFARHLTASITTSCAGWTSVAAHDVEATVFSGQVECCADMTGKRDGLSDQVAQTAMRK